MITITRRYFLLTSLAGAFGFPRLAMAQPGTRVRRLGWLSPLVSPRPTFRDAMRELGHVEGKTFVFETRIAEDKYERLPALAAELVSAKVDLIVAVGPAAVRAAKGATKSIPIVIAWWGGPDLVESGVVASFARPGGNITGVHMLSMILDEKRLELLLQAVPAAKRVGVLTHEGIQFEPMLAPIRKAATALAVQLHTVDVGEAGGYERAFDVMVQKGVQALLVVASPKFDPERKLDLRAGGPATNPHDVRIECLRGGGRADGLRADSGGVGPPGGKPRRQDSQGREPWGSAH